METRRLAATSLLLPLALAACATVERPTPDQLGDRVRVRIAGRDIPSITSADYFLFFTVVKPDGERVPVRVRAVETTGAGGLSLAIAVTIELRCGCGALALAPSLGGEHDPHVADIVMASGHALDFAPGNFFAYRIDADNERQAADVAPEIRLGQVTADATRYVELTPTDGPELAVSGRPPGFEAAR